MDMMFPFVFNMPMRPRGEGRIRLIICKSFLYKRQLSANLPLYTLARALFLLRRWS